MASSIYQQGKDLYYNAAGTSNLTKIADPTQLQSLAKSGAVEVGKAYKPYDSFNVNVPPVIKAPTSATTPAVNLPPTTPAPDYKTTIQNVPTFDISKFTSTADKSIADAQATNTGLGTKILSMMEKIGGKSAALAAKQNELGVNTYNKQLTDITSQIQQLQKENQITKLDSQGQPIAQEEINKQTADADRRYAVKSLGLSSISQTIQGNLSLASDLATKAIDTEYGAYESQLKYLETALNLNKDTMTSAEKKRAEELQLYIENQKTAIESAKEEKKNIYTVMTEAAKNGADSVTLNKILGAKTAAEALTLAGNYAQDVSNKVIGTENTGYYERQPDGSYKQVIAPTASSGGATPSQIINAANAIQSAASDRGETITREDAIAQAQREFAALNGGGYNSNPSPTNGPTPTNTKGALTTDAQTIANAIKQIESGGNYSAKGASGENGAYQFMPATWKSWAKQFLGDANAPMSQANQDKVATAKVQSLLDQGYNAQQIALIWNGGTPVVKKGVNSKGVAYDSGAYASKVLSVLGGTNPNTVISPSTTPELAVERNLANIMDKPDSELTPPELAYKLTQQAKNGDLGDTVKLPFEPQISNTSSKFTPAFYATKLGQKNLDNEATAKNRFEANQIVKDFNAIQDQYSSMQAIAESGTGGPQDLALVYTFMKALDPTSVVRESEYNSAAGSGNVFSGWAAKYNGYLKENGGILPANVRTEFLKIINSRLEAKTKQYNNYASQTRDIAARQGLNPDNVAIQFKFNPTANLSKSSSVEGYLNSAVGGVGNTDSYIKSLGL
ncbi:MAG: hypothetical protein WC551_02600 [Patescibacteria group bacterium]